MEARAGSEAKALAPLHPSELVDALGRVPAAVEADAGGATELLVLAAAAVLRAALPGAGPAATACEAAFERGTCEAGLAGCGWHGMSS